MAGPTISLSEGHLVVRYDAERGDHTEWAEIVFHDVIKVCYRDSSVCDEDDITGPDYMIEENDTPALQALLERRRTFLGLNHFDTEKDAREPLRLYHVYFDDAAALYILARSFELKPSEGME